MCKYLFFFFFFFAKEYISFPPGPKSGFLALMKPTEIFDFWFSCILNLENCDFTSLISMTLIENLLSLCIGGDSLSWQLIVISW